MSDSDYSDNIFESPIASSPLAVDYEDILNELNMGNNFGHGDRYFDSFDGLFPSNQGGYSIISDIIDDIKTYNLSEYQVHNFIVNHCNLGVIAHVLSKFRWKTDELYASIRYYQPCVNAYNENNLHKLLLLVEQLSPHVNKNIKYVMLRIADNPSELIDYLREIIDDFRLLIVDIYNDPSTRLNLPSKFRPAELDNAINDMTMLDNEFLTK